MEHAVVVGGGLVGCVLAMYLARRGHTVQVFERHSDARAGQATKRPALNITLCERGLRALGRVGVLDLVRALSVPVYGRRVHGVDGAVAYQPYDNSGEAI